MLRGEHRDQPTSGGHHRSTPGSASKRRRRQFLSGGRLWDVSRRAARSSFPRRGNIQSKPTNREVPEELPQDSFSYSDHPRFVAAAGPYVRSAAAMHSNDEGLGNFVCCSSHQFLPTFAPQRANAEHNATPILPVPLSMIPSGGRHVVCVWGSAALRYSSNYSKTPLGTPLADESHQQS